MNNQDQKTGIQKLKELFGHTQSIIFLATLALMLASYTVNDAFFSPYNMSTLLRTMSFTAIVAIGQTMVLLLGDIDLSVGSIACFVSIVTGTLMVNTTVPPVLLLVLGLGIGGACGFINGFLITRFKINAFIITMGMSYIWEGLVYVITGGNPVLGIPPELTFIGRGMVGGFLAVPLLIMLALAVGISYMLRYTPFGRKIFAIGGNDTAAKLVGIRVENTKIRVFILSGVFAAAAGLLMMLRLSAAQPTIGINWVMPSITAAVLGGTSMTGGRGGILGTILGALLMTVISNAIVIMRISTYMEQVVIGAVVIIAVLADALRIRMSQNR